MLQISELFVYPVKSLKGIKLSSALVTDRGFKYDRRWMLIDEQNRFITQRQIPQLALFRISITERGLEVDHTVFKGGEAFEEDALEYFTINNIHFYGVKLSARCAITTINQENASRGTEPLKTLSTYRLKNNKIYFGQNLVHSGQGIISTGDIIEVRKKKSLKNFREIM